MSELICLPQNNFFKNFWRRKKSGFCPQKIVLSRFDLHDPKMVLSSRIIMKPGTKLEQKLSKIVVKNIRGSQTCTTGCL